MADDTLSFDTRTISTRPQSPRPHQGGHPAGQIKFLPQTFADQPLQQYFIELDVHPSTAGPGTLIDFTTRRVKLNPLHPFRIESTEMQRLPFDNRLLFGRFRHGLNGFCRQINEPLPWRAESFAFCIEPGFPPALQFSSLVACEFDHTNPLDITRIQFFNYTCPIPL